MRPEFIFEYGKLWLISGWICSSSYSVIKLSFVSSYNSSCSTSASSMYCYFVLIRWVSSWVFSIGLIWCYGSSNWTEFTFGLCRAMVARGGSVLDVSVFLLMSFFHDPFLWLFWGSCYLAEFFFINNGPLRGKLSSLPSCCINNYLTPLLLILHPI